MLVISELTGGLGNQLFQYATGFAAAKRAGAAFRLDLRHFDIVIESLPSRPFALNKFTISAPTISSWDRLRISMSTFAERPRRLIRIWRQLRLPRMDVIVDKAEGHDGRLTTLKRDTYLSGCWQTERLFSEFRDLLLNEFRWRHPPGKRNAELINQIESSTSISVHFRRTDYLQQSTLLKPCGLDYYERAFAAMQLRFPEASYFIFTDDAAWVRANAALPPQSTVIDHNAGVDDAQDMRLMSHCRHFIIANSTFSWWGAWLAKNPDKHIIAPAIWYQAGHGSENELVPCHWMRL